MDAIVNDYPCLFKGVELLTVDAFSLEHGKKLSAKALS